MSDEISKAWDNMLEEKFKKGENPFAKKGEKDDDKDDDKNLDEAVDVNAIIKELTDTSFGGSNEAQLKSIQLLKGLATSDDPAANAFMKKLDAWTSSLKKGVK